MSKEYLTLHRFLRCFPLVHSFTLRLGRFETLVMASNEKPTRYMFGTEHFQGWLDFLCLLLNLGVRLSFRSRYSFDVIPTYGVMMPSRRISRTSTNHWRVLNCTPESYAL
jgi:hypothetical protein